MPTNGAGGAALPEYPPGRLISLDAFRGLAIAGMILVNNPGSWGHIYGPLAHAEWHGWTPTDLIFPFFLFIVGVAMPFSFGKRRERGSGRGELFKHVLRRSAILVGLGLVINGFPDYDLSEIRYSGVLQRIGVVYLLASTLYLGLDRKGIWAASGILLAGYWAAMTLVPVPGHGAGDLSMEGNLATWVDNQLLSGHMWLENFDPEGILSTFPAVVTTLLGILIGEWIRSDRSKLRTTVGLFVAANAALFAGWAWGHVFPINKQLWTSSYVLFTAGVGLHLLALLYWIMDVRERRGWAKPLVWYGMNAIAVFVGSAFVGRVIGSVVTVGGGAGEAVALKTWIYRHLFASWAGPLNGSLAYAATYVLLWLGVCWLLYRKRIFIKI